MSILWLGFAAAGCEPAAPALAHAPFWQVSYEGRSSTLLGTMHDVVDADELPTRLWEELEVARVVVTEADVGAIDRREFEAAIALPEGQSVRSAVAAGDWDAIVEALDGIATADEIDTTQPWYTQGALVRAIVPQVDDPIDTTLVDRAILARVRPAFLETWREQVEMLNALGLDYGVDLLLSTVRDQAGTEAAFLAWAAAYRAGDVDRLEALSFDPADVAARPEYFEQIVFARNEAWLAGLEDEFRAGGAFVAVGFMHLPTDRGLLRRLEDDGFALDLVEP